MKGHVKILDVNRYCKGPIYCIHAFALLDDFRRHLPVYYVVSWLAISVVMEEDMEAYLKGRGMTWNRQSYWLGTLPMIAEGLLLNNFSMGANLQHFGLPKVISNHAMKNDHQTITGRLYILGKNKNTNNNKDLNYI